MLTNHWQVVRRGLEAKLYSQQTLEQALQQCSDTPASEADAAKLLIKLGLVTRYQAKLLVRGVTNGFYIGPYKLLSPLKQNEYCRYYGAEHSESGEKHILCVLRPDQPDHELSSQFADRVKARQLPEMPEGTPKKVCTFGSTQVAVLHPPHPDACSTGTGSFSDLDIRQPKHTRPPGDSTVETEKLPTLDDLPVLDMAASNGLAPESDAPDISNLLEEPKPKKKKRKPRPEVLDDYKDIAEDEPLVAVEASAGNLLEPVQSDLYDVKRPKKKHKAKAWRPSPRLVVGVVGGIVFLVLVLTLRNEILSGF